METLNTIDGERPMPNVSSVQKTRWIRGAAVVSGIAVISGGAVMALAMLNQPEPVDTTQRDMRVASSVPARTFVFEPEYVEPPAPALPVIVQPVTPAPLPLAKPTSLSKPVQRRVVDKSASGINVVATQQASAQGVQVAQNGDSGTGLFGGEGGGGHSALGNALTPTQITGVSATQMRNLNNMLVQGMSLDCVLTTSIDTSNAGMASCNTTAPVWSVNGDSLLIPAGSRVTGEYRSASRGSNRVAVLWSRLLTPDGRAMQLDSLATGPQGISGIQGTVNHKFWERLGTALLVSIISDVASAATRSDTTADVVIGGAANTSATLATEILKDSIGIQPSIGVQAGSRTAIYIARDIDFTAVMP